MRRRRGEISLFEILRQPQPAPEAPPEEKSRPKAPEEPRRAKKTAVRESLLAEGVGSAPAHEVDPVHGSTTPPPPEPAPRPRIDVSLTPRTPRRLAELAEELVTPEDEGPRWWQRDLTIRPVVIGIAAVGVLLSWLVVYQIGAGSGESELARLDRFAGADAPAWDIPIVHGAPGRQPEVRHAEGPGGAPVERIPATTTAGNALLPVVMVAQKLGRPENAESLMLHIEAYLETGIAHVTPFRGDFAVFIGPFDGAEEAKQALQKIRSIPKFKTTDFRDAYVHELEFTPEEQRLLGRE